MDIAAHIGKLVLEHECVIIPELGGFLTNYNTAEIKPQQHHILPPSRTLVFNSQLNTNDGLLANYLANQLDISYKTSLLLLEVFVNYCQRDLAEGKQIAFGNLGMLDMNTNNKLEFHPNTSINYNEDAFGLKAIPLKSIERKPDFSLQAPLMKKLVKPPKTKVIKLNGLALRKIAAVIIPLGILISAVFYFPSAHNNLQQTSLFSFLDSSKSALPSADKDVNLGELKVQQAEDNSSQEITEIDNSIPSEMDESIAIETNGNEFIVKESKVELPKGQFHIICGSFIEKERAEVLVDRLKAEGFKAFIAGQSKLGTYRVSMLSFTNAQDATRQINWVRHQGYDRAWILNKIL